MDAIADVVMTGVSINNNFGFSVSGIGDVNKDTMTILLSVHMVYNSNTGRAYVFYGERAWIRQPILF